MAAYFGPSRPFQGDSSLAFLTQIDGQYFEFIPRSLFEKGLVVDDVQYFFPQVLRPDFYSSLESNSTFVDVNELAGAVGEDLVKDLRKKGYEDQAGYLIPMSESDGKLISWTDSYLEKGFDDRKLGSFKDPQSGITFKAGPITGLGERDGQRFYSFEAENPNLTSVYGMYTYDPSSDRAGGGVHWYDYDPGPSWAKPLRAVGYGLLGLGTAGLAGFGPLAAGAGSAAGAGAAGGATLATSTAIPGSFQAALPGLGVQTAATTAGATAIPGSFAAAVPGLLTAAPSAPIYFADAVSANELAFPAQEVGQAFTPAPGSFQSALPGLGVETQASAGGFTAAPGSFQAALPSLGIASAPSLAMNLPSQASSLLSTDNLTNALRLGNALMGQPQQQQQGLLGGGGGRQPGSVDYSGVLGLLQQQARTPGVSSLTAPAQLQPMFQPTLLPNIMSLLG
jgi:hypothetical protein